MALYKALNKLQVWRGKLPWGGWIKAEKNEALSSLAFPTVSLFWWVFKTAHIRLCHTQMCLPSFSQFGGPWGEAERITSSPMTKKHYLRWEEEAVNKNEQLWTRAHRTERVLCLPSPVSSLASLSPVNGQRFSQVDAESRASVPGNGSDPDQNMGQIGRYQLQNGLLAGSELANLGDHNSAFEASLWICVPEMQRNPDSRAVLRLRNDPWDKSFTVVYTRF